MTGLLIIGAVTITAGLIVIYIIRRQNKKI